jgi:hypothetical protein
MVMTPPHAQLHTEPLARAGLPPIIVRGATGTQGMVTGTHGIGTRTPSAAAVAEATVGFDSVVHMPNGGMLTMGAESVMVAAGLPSIMTRETGSGESDDGATPNEQVSIAPWVTLIGMRQCLPRRAGVVQARPAAHRQAQRFEFLTDAFSLPPVVVTKQSTLRSCACSQLRAEGSRKVKNSAESR